MDQLSFQVETQEYLTAAAFVARTDKYCHPNQLGPSTAAVVCAMQTFSEGDPRRPDISEDDRAVAWRTKISAQKAMKDTSKLSDFYFRMYGSITGETVEAPDGLACTAVQVQLMLDREAALMARLRRGKFIGVLGEQLDLELRLLTAKPVKTPFGDRVVHEAECDGSMVTWFFRREACDIGQDLKVRGVVRSHTMFGRMPQTRLSHVIVAKVIDYDFTALDSALEARRSQAL